jgi:hypothetical protein
LDLTLFRIEYKITSTQGFDIVEDFQVLEMVGHFDKDPEPLPEQLNSRSGRREVPVPIPLVETHPWLHPASWQSVAPGMPPVTVHPASPKDVSRDYASPGGAVQGGSTPENSTDHGDLWHLTNISRNTTPKARLPTTDFI